MILVYELILCYMLFLECIKKRLIASYGMQEKRDLHYLLLNGRRIEKR